MSTETVVRDNTMPAARVAPVQDALPDRHTLAERVLAEQVHIAMKHLPFMLWTSPIALLLWVYLVWNEVPRINIIAWLILVSGIHALMGLSILWYRRQAPYETGAGIWARNMVIIAFFY